MFNCFIFFLFYFALLLVYFTLLCFHFLCFDMSSSIVICLLAYSYGHFWQQGSNIYLLLETRINWLELRGVRSSSRRRNYLIAMLLSSLILTKVFFYYIFIVYIL